MIRVHLAQAFELALESLQTKLHVVVLEGSMKYADAILGSPIQLTLNTL